MSYLAIIVSFGGLAGLLIYASSIIKDSKLEIVKGFLFLWGVINVLLLGLYPMLISLNPSDVSSVQPVTIGAFSINVLLIMLFAWLYGSSIFGRLAEMFNKLRGRGDD